MRKDTIIGFAALLIIIIGIALYAAMRPAPAKAPGIGAGIVLPAGGYREHAQYYDISADYATSTPLLLSAGAEEDAAARALMEGFVRDTIAQFKNDGNFDHLTSEDIHMMGFDQGRKEKLQIVYLIASSPSTVSYIFTIYEDTLGAHGNLFFHTFTFDAKTGAALALADLFSPGARYLDTLSSISRAKLPGIIGPDADTSFITGGTTPEDKNFENFFFDNKEFVVLFPPYQVGPYSAGPQTLRIPVSDLADILKPSYR
ncbi:MAG: DUF3298 domain-containing protein [Patescibacteria group bacterium]|nr:DUF3298 domain-containing protein [Patescibacteria group bacterium]